MSESPAECHNSGQEPTPRAYIDACTDFLSVEDFENLARLETEVEIVAYLYFVLDSHGIQAEEFFAQAGLLVNIIAEEDRLD